MVIQKGGSFLGRKGVLIFYERFGLRIVRVVPAKVRQTKSTQQRAFEYGMASRLVTRLAQLLRAGTGFEGEQLKNLAGIEGFPFTITGLPFKERWLVPTDITIPSRGLLEIH